MTARLITEIGGAYSNSYVTLQQADAFATTFPWYPSNGSTGWLDFTEEQRTQALINAAFAMQTLPWAGVKCSPASDAGRYANDWDQYWITIRDWSSGGIFGYFFDDAFARGSGQGDEVFKWGVDGGVVLPQVSSYRAKTFETGLRFWDVNGVQITVDRYEVLTSEGTSGDQTRDVVYYWDSPVDISYITGSFNDAFNPGRSGTWYWGVYVNGEQLFNFPGTTADQPQKLAWPRSGVTCQGLTATCSVIPQSIKEAQVLVAYNFLINPSLVPGTPVPPDNTPTGTYIAEQTLGDMSIKYAAFPNGSVVDDCKVCGEAVLISSLPWLKGLLGCFLSNQGSNRVILRVRS